jgi:hypothetical protein
MIGNEQKRGKKPQAFNKDSLFRHKPLHLLQQKENCGILVLRNSCTTKFVFVANNMQQYLLA